MKVLELQWFLYDPLKQLSATLQLSVSESQERKKVSAYKIGSIKSKEMNLN